MNDKDKKTLDDKQLEDANGGTSVESAVQPPVRLFCPNCKSLDITAKSFAYNGNHQLMAVLHCNSCGNEWKTLAKKLGPGYGQTA